MSMCRTVSCVVGRRCLLWSVRFLGKTVGLCPASFCTWRQNLPITPGISWLPTFESQSSMMKRTFFFFGVLKGLVGLHRTFNFSFFGISGWDTDLDYCDIEWLGNEQRSFCHFWDSNQVLHFELLCYEGCSVSTKGFLPRVVDIMVIWIKFTHSSPF